MTGRMRAAAWASAVLLVGGMTLLLSGLDSFWSFFLVGLGTGGTALLTVVYLSGQHPPRGGQR